MVKLYKFLLVTCIVLIFIFLNTACQLFKGADDDKGNNVIEEIATVDTSYKVYYLTKDKYSIEGLDYKFVSDTPTTLIGECLIQLEQAPPSQDHIETIPDGIEVLNYEYDSNSKQANIYFSRDYYNIDKTTEVLVRAAVVKTLTQFDNEIDYVQFFVNNEPMLEKNGGIMIMMKSDFVDNTKADVKHLRERALTLFFASSDGTLLVVEDVYVHHINTATAEQVVAESLISGPLSKTLNQTFSADTKLNSVSISEGICTIDFNQKFLERINQQSFILNVYSVVNSLCQLSTVERVQILINGSVVTEQHDGVDISYPLEPNMDIVLKTSESPLLTNDSNAAGSGETAE